MTVMAWLRTLPNTYVIKVNQVSSCGHPDILCCMMGMFIAIELKTDTGRVTKLQQYNLDKITACGGLSLTVRPKTYKDFKEIIHGIRSELQDASFPAVRHSGS
jgi:hypothetical protein